MPHANVTLVQVSSTHQSYLIQTEADQEHQHVDNLVSNKFPSKRHHDEHSSTHKDPIFGVTAHHQGSHHLQHRVLLTFLLWWHEDSRSVIVFNKPAFLRMFFQHLVTLPLRIQRVWDLVETLRHSWPVRTSSRGETTFLFLLKFSFTDWRTSSQNVRVKRTWRQRTFKKPLIWCTSWRAERIVPEWRQEVTSCPGWMRIRCHSSFREFFKPLKVDLFGKWTLL